MNKAYTLHRYNFPTNSCPIVGIIITEDLKEAVEKTVAHLGKEGEVSRLKEPSIGLAEFRVIPGHSFGAD